MFVLVFLSSLLFQQSLTAFEVVGSVRDTRGQIVGGVRISVIDENFQPLYTAFVDTSGRFTVRVKTGKYIFRIDTTGTPYQELQTGWVELSSLRRNGGATEVYPLDLVLKFKPGSGPTASPGTTFAQDVPAPARKEYERGAKNLAGNKKDAGVVSLKKAIELFPNYFDALELLGIEYVRNGQYDEAIAVLKKALEINDRAARTMYALGVAHLKLSHLKEAIEYLEKSAKVDPTSSNTQMMLGLAYGSSGMFEQSESAFRKALQQGGAAAAEAHFYLAGLYNKLEKYQEAAQELTAYLREGKNIKDPPQIRAMIEKLKEKDKTRGSLAETTPAQPLTLSGAQTLPAGPGATATEAESEAARPVAEPGVPAAPRRREPEPVAPLPEEMKELLHKSAESGSLMNRRLLDYTYQLKKTRRILNERGKPIHVLEQVFEAYPVRGEHVLIMLSKDGIPSKNVADERKRAVQQLEEAERERREKPAGDSARPDNEGYVSAGVSGVYNGRPSYISINVSEFLRACEFHSPRVENLNGRPTVVMSFRPRAGMKLSPNYEYIARLIGTVWIDQADGIVTRLEGWPDTEAAFDLVQTTAPREEAALIYQQERQASGLWFPSLIRMNAGGRDLFDGLNWDVVFEFSGYQQFNTSADEVKIKTPPKGQ
ncbi:MAG: tetratricopeptide repeat protein [Blastocatellia bacterium]